MPSLTYSSDQLLASHPYAKSHSAAGYNLHGGFVAGGKYQSPRTLHRWPAVLAWQGQLADQGWPLIDASADLLKRGNYPNLAQQALLLKHGLGQSFWNALTITGVIEAQGQALCDYPAPHWQDVIVQDITETCTGHLEKGLLWAHGADEGGDPDHPEVGAHDAMWFAARDLAFGKDAFPLPEVPESISRPQEGPPFPHLPDQFGGLLALLMNVLMIEIRAEAFFSFSIDLLRHPATFLDHKKDAELAASMIERIRIDEAIHVAYLQTTISEMRSFTFKTLTGGTVQGAEMIDPFWAELVRWHGQTQFDENAKRARANLEPLILDLTEGGQVLREFDALTDGAISAGGS